MRLQDMKHPKSKSEAEPTEAVKSEGPRYPHGLRLHLDHEEMKKLGLTEAPKVGSKVHVKAHAHVTSVSMNDSAESGARRHMELQITKLALHHDAPEADDSETSGKLYGNKK